MHPSIFKMDSKSCLRPAGNHPTFAELVAAGRFDQIPGKVLTKDEVAKLLAERRKKATDDLPCDDCHPDSGEAKPVGKSGRKGFKVRMAKGFRVLAK